MAKYAMIYFVALAAVAAALRLIRPAARDLAIAAAVTLAVVAPNIWWNLDNGFITFAHTAGNAGWAGIAWNWSGLAEFVATQIVAMGPVFGVGFVMLLVRRDLPKGGAVLLLFSLPIFLAVAAQALIRGANGNWAAPAFLAALALVAPWVFLKARRVFWLGLAFNAAIALALPVAPAFPDRLAVNGRLVFDRAMGMQALGETILDRATQENLRYVIASDRGLLAALVYLSKGRDIRVLSLPAVAPNLPNSHYQLTRSALEDTLPALFVTLGDIPQDCAEGARIIDEFQPATGGLKRFRIKLVVVTKPCFPT
jgi:hypothetical protein